MEVVVMQNGGGGGGGEMAGQYRGVRKRKWGKWVSEIRGAREEDAHLGSGAFESPEMAAVAHDVAALRLRGPGRVPQLPGDRPPPSAAPDTAEPGDVRAAALEAAAQVRFTPDLLVVAGGDDARRRCCSAGEAEAAAVAAAAWEWDVVVGGGGDELEAKSPNMWAELAEAMLMAPPVWEGGGETDNDEWAQQAASLWDPSVWDY
ncbi:hypothetical protein OsJ_33496 [Oryza sativa Japonica Group]|uniref:AP2/ERF domain-containing protein n=1 Tax=Oryza sativa subsp. japonica TaxID=39947 RepID=A3CA39_ORYSJ|nr:hypothetical protein OsJ_33496 [Oryza sativa Japonica Group]